MGLTLADLCADSGHNGNGHNGNGHHPSPHRRRAASTTGAPRQIVATYPYRDEGSVLLYEAVRYEPKDFRPRLPDGTPGLPDHRVLYRLPELRALKGDRPVFLVEG
jgi:hypothetical protein